MDTQNTPTHIRLWHRDFWLLAIVNLLLSTMVYMQLSVVSLSLADSRGLGISTLERGAVVGVYGLGIFLLGPYCHYLAQRFPRKRVCQWAIVLMLAVTGLLALLFPRLSGHALFITGLVGMFWYGAFFGLAQMLLSSTLVIDVTESAHRTEANYSSAWFRRFAIAVGPLLALLLPIKSVASPLCLYGYLAIVVLLELVHVPFKSPDDDTHVFCTDRFLLSQGKWLGLNLVLVTVVIGMSVAIAFRNETFFTQFAIGLVLALIAERYVFANAELESEFVTGAFVVIAALLMFVTRSGMPMVEHLSPALLGLGSGLIGSRILMFYIKLADHCQRGTAQSSFFLSWEFGFAVGLMLAEWLTDYHLLDMVGLVLMIVAVTVYHFFTHKWYMSHKSR